MESAPLRPHTDRNLLFGILALQMDFITRDALIAAMNAWVLEKSKPIAQILREHQALGEEEHALLEALVRKHLALHADDPAKSLSALSSIGSVRQELERINDPGVQASLAQVSVAHEHHAALSTRHPEGDEYPPDLSLPSVGVPTSTGQRFRILRPHARGGLGQVSVALDEELHREVALKEIQGKHADDPIRRQRFLLEAEITGGLEHPGIVPVYGLGTYADGRPFYAMRFIKGDSLHDAIKRYHEVRPRGPGERALAMRKLLGRFVDVCNAIAYAHSRGVLHRDLKPGNIMLGQYGETLVVDWGLAKVLGQASVAAPSEEKPLQPASGSGSAPTQMGSAVGTPQFMSPEQAEGRLDLLGPCSDVYSLGATLYAVLTGRPPVEAEELTIALRLVQKGDIPRPRQLKSDIPIALEAICLKAMALKPIDRYVSVRALADDVERWLADEPTTVSGAEPLGERFTRWTRRHRTLVTATAVLLVTAVLALSVSVFFINDARALADQNALAEAESRRKAEDAQKSEAKALELATQKAAAEGVATRLATRLALDEGEARKRAQKLYREARVGTYASSVALAEREWLAGNLPVAEQILDGCPWDLRGWEWDYVRRITQSSLMTLTGHSDNILGADYSPNGKRLATGDSSAVKVWDADTGKELLSFKTDGKKLAYSPDGKQIATIGGEYSKDFRRPLRYEGEVRLWDAATGKQLRVLKGHGQWMQAVAWSPDGKKLASCAGSTSEKPWPAGELFLWDAEKGERLDILKGHTGPVYQAAFSPDGARLVSAGGDGTARVWDLDTGKELFAYKGHTGKGTGEVASVAYRPDGKQVASGGYREVRIWDADTGKDVTTLLGHTDWVVSAVWNRDGSRLASGSWDLTVRVWDARKSEQLFSLKGHTSKINRVAFRPDGRHVASVSWDYTVRIWDALNSPERRIFTGHRMEAQDVAFSPDGTRIVSVGGDPLGEGHHGPPTLPGEIHVWDPATGQTVHRRRPQGGHVKDVAFSPDGKLLATGHMMSYSQFTNVAREPGVAKLWDTATGEEILTIKGHHPDVNAVAFSPDSKHLATAGPVEFLGIKGHAVMVWDVPTGGTGTPRQTLSGHTGDIHSVAFSPDGARLASGSKDQTVRIWDTKTGKVLFTCRGHTAEVHQVVFSPDGKQLASVSWGYADRAVGEVKVWDPATGIEVATIKGYTSRHARAGFTPDGKVLYTLGTHYDRTIGQYGKSWSEIKLWELPAGKELRTIALKDTRTVIAFSPDGKRLAVGKIGMYERDGLLSMIDVATGNELYSVEGHSKGLEALAFSADGKRFASGSSDRTAKVWDTETGRPLFALPGHSAPIWAVTYSGDGRFYATAGEDKEVLLWDARTHRQVRVFAGHTGPVHAVALSSDGKLLASGSSDDRWVLGRVEKYGMVKVWETATGKEVFSSRSHKVGVNGVAFFPDGKVLASASGDRTVRLWDVSTGKELRQLLGHTSAVLCVAFSRDGSRLASGSRDHTIKVWDPATGAELLTIKGHTPGVARISFSPDGKRIASAGGKTIRVWELDSGRQAWVFRDDGKKDESADFAGVAFSHDGRRLAAARKARQKGEIHLWEATPRSEPRILRGHTADVYSATFSPDGSRLASLSGDRTIKVWDLTTGEEERSLPARTEPLGSWVSGSYLGAPLASTTPVAYSRDGKYLAGAGPDKTVKVWDARTGAEVHSLPGHLGEVTSVAFSPDGQRLVSGAGLFHRDHGDYLDGEVKLWDLTTGQAVCTFREPPQKALARATLIGLGSGTGWASWPSSVLARQFYTLRTRAVSVSTVVFSPDGKLFASATGSNVIDPTDGLVRVRETATGREVLTLKDHDGDVWGIAFTPDGRRLVTAATGHSSFRDEVQRPPAVKQWDVETGKNVPFQKPIASYVRCFSISPDGKWLAGIAGKELSVWDLATGELAASVAGKYDPFGSFGGVSFSADGKWLATTKAEIRIWEFSKLLELRNTVPR